MTTRCKHGDIAIIINETPQCTGNIGRLVHVRGPYMYLNILQKFGWVIKPVGGKKLWVQLRSNVDHPVLEKIYWNNPRCIPDAWLLPLRGLSDLPSEDTGADELTLEHTIADAI
jgi:hypothetical protein